MKIPLHLILIYFLCRIHPRPTMSDEVFCGELDKNTKKPESSFLELSDFFNIMIKNKITQVQLAEKLGVSDKT